jgi:plastocyanin
MYILPNFQNPAGVTLSEGRRHEMILLADKYGIPIVEDDPYGQLRYEGEHLPPLVVLDRENLRRDDGFTLGNVIYLSTFSKTLAPGIRLAWIVAPEDVIQKLVQLKQAADLHSSTFTQYVAYEVARDGFLDQHVRLIRQVYRERRDTMLQALHEYFPPEVTWTHPKGGLFLWVTMPEGTDSQALFRAALAENVAFVALDLHDVDVDPVADGHAFDDVAARRELRGWDEAFGFGADVDEHAFAVNADHGALHDLPLADGRHAGEVDVVAAVPVNEAGTEYTLTTGIVPESQLFSFDPSSIEVPAGSRVTFYVTSPDVVHGFFIPDTAVNMMVVPGWVSDESHTFNKPGTYLLLCNEYCGAGHHFMYGSIVVK